MARPPSGKRVTIRDVARFARVSHQTVSRFINDGNHIAPWTRTRVEQAITKLGFRPSHIARSLVTRQTKTVGLVMGDVASPFFPDVARGAEDVLAPAGYSLILSSSRRDPERELRNVRHLLERATDGLILGAPQCPPGDLAELAQRAGVPMVFLNREVAAPTSRPSGSTGRAPRPRSRRTSRSSGIGASPWSSRPERRPGWKPGGLVPSGAGKGRPSAPSGRWSSARACRSRAGTAPASACLPSPPGRPQPSVTTT